MNGANYFTYQNTTYSEHSKLPKAKKPDTPKYIITKWYDVNTGLVIDRLTVDHLYEKTEYKILEIKRTLDNTKFKIGDNVHFDNGKYFKIKRIILSGKKPKFFFIPINGAEAIKFTKKLNIAI